MNEAIAGLLPQQVGFKFQLVYICGVVSLDISSIVSNVMLGKVRLGYGVLGAVT